jgi:hypothetical protein
MTTRLAITQTTQINTAVQIFPNRTFDKRSLAYIGFTLHVREEVSDINQYNSRQ